MASLPQLSATLGVCISSKIKSIDARPCIAQLSNNKKKSVCLEGALFPLTLVGEKRPKIESWKQQSEKWKVWAGESSELVPRSVIESVVKDFHRAFNGKNIEQLQQLISDDCEYQDYLFYSPYKGQENVIKFLQNVMEAMGPNIKISVGEINVEDVKEAKLMATVFWHLGERKRYGGAGRKSPSVIPHKAFTLFKLSGETTKRNYPSQKDADSFGLKKLMEDWLLAICSKITGLEELPIKPGELALNALKAISTFLDSYPPMAAVLLNYPAFQDD